MRFLGLAQLLVAFATGLQRGGVGLDAIGQVLPFLGGKLVLMILGFTEQDVRLLVFALPL